MQLQEQKQIPTGWQTKVQAQAKVQTKEQATAIATATATVRRMQQVIARVGGRRMRL
jgi:hypothetical protein